VRAALLRSAAVAVIYACSSPSLTGLLFPCSSDADCTEETICALVDGEKACVPKGTDGGVEAAPPPDAGPEAPATCASNAACIASTNGPAICRKPLGKCAPLLSVDCTTVLGVANLASDDVIVMGTLMPVTGSNAATGLARQNSVDLAVSEITANVVGVPGGSGGKPRPLAFVACDDTVDKIRAATHLVEDVGVPAIVAAGTSGNTIAVAQQVTIPAGVLLFSPSATAASITTLQDNGLVWRTAPSDVLQAVPLKDQLADLNTLVGNAAKLAILNKDDAYGTGLSAAVLQGLMWNGAPLDTSGTTFKQFQYSASATDISPTTLALDQFRPDVVLVVGTAEAITQAMTPIETTGTSRPQWLLSDGARRPELLTLVTAHPAMRSRVRGTVPFTTSPLAGSFFTRYAAAYPGPPTPVLLFGMAGAYDIVYLLAYAMTAEIGKPVTGASLDDGLKFTVGGATPVDVGADALSPAFKLLQAGTKIDFNGASGPLDFDVDTGEATSDIDVWCVKGAGDAGTTDFGDAKRYYDATQGKIVGTFTPCP
jgi:branched-chain amino acid transport system substrate-binding protein